MPALVTIQLNAPARLFFNEGWPLEERLLEILAKGNPPEPAAGRQASPFKPYTLSPLWRCRDQTQSSSATLADPTAYRWRVSFLNEALLPPFLAGLQATKTLSLAEATLTVGEAGVKIVSYADIARQAREQVRANPQAARHVNLAFITPVILRRRSLPMPLPEPVAVFHHYLAGWDTFAPRELWVNVNALDAVEAHLAITDHQLESRTVRLESGPPKTGFLGHVTYKMMAWEKLGAEFLGHLQMLARFAEICGTGEYTERGLGQTRLKRQAGLSRRQL